MSEDSLPIRNKIQESGIQVLDPSDFLVPDSQIQPLDLAHYMDEWGVLREKDFRARVQAMDPTPFAGRWVALYCSSEAVWPPWAVMILAVHLQGGDYTTRPAGIEYGTPGQVQRQLALARIQQLDTDVFGPGIPPIRLKIGLSSGTVLAGLFGANERMQYTLIGDPVNVASRLTQLAQPGQILTTASLAARVNSAASVVVSESTPIMVKGKADPIETCSVTAQSAQEVTTKGVTT